jgi:hypothetical protein
LYVPSGLRPVEPAVPAIHPTSKLVGILAKGIKNLWHKDCYFISKIMYYFLVCVNLNLVDQKLNSMRDVDNLYPSNI